VDLWVTLVVILACMAVKAFLSGAEIALYAADRLKIYQHAEQGSRTAKLIQQALEKPEQLLGSTMVLQILAVVVGTSLATAFLVEKLQRGGEWAGFLMMGGFVLIIGGILPKVLAQRYADRLVGLVIYPLHGIMYACDPIARLSIWFVNQGLQAVHAQPEKKNPFATRGELDILASLRDRSSTLGIDEQRMIRRIFGFSDTRVHEAMIPLVEVVALEDTASLDELVQAICQHGFSRIPIFQDNSHNIVGWVNAFDVLSLPPSARSFRQLIRPAYYVPEQRRIGDLLKDVQQKGIPLAVVVDEYGGAVGIVTIEDMLEEIVGEIEDEYDAREHLYEVLPDGSFRIDARMEIDAINEALSLMLPTGDYTTLAGFILSQLERIPQRGELLMHEGLMLEIEEATNRAIEQVRVFPRLAPRQGSEKSDV
jgi:putative hemolysin